MRLKRVHRDGPAERACLQAGDELLALDDLRLRGPEDLALALAIPTAAAERQLLFCREGRVRSTGLQPDPPAIASWQLVIDPDRDSAHTRDNRQRWLSLQP